MGEEEAATRYRFGPLERRGLIAGWRGGQIAAVATGLVVAVGLLRARPSPVGGVLGFLAVAVGVAVATWPLAGRTAEQWVPEVARHLDVTRLQRRAGRHRPFAALRVLEVELAPDGAIASEPTDAVGCRGWSASGATFGPVDGERHGEVHGAVHGAVHDAVHGAVHGVVHDAAAQTYTAVLAVSSPGFVLLGAAEKSRRVAAWAGVLASLAREGSSVHRLQWVERSLPDDGTSVRRHLDAHAALDPEAPSRRSYAGLVESEAGTVHRHEVLVAVTVHAGQASRAVRAAGGGRRGACALLLREAASLARRLRDAGFEAEGALSPGDVARTIRRAVDGGGPGVASDEDPGRRSGRDGGSSVRRRLTPAGWPGPMGMSAEWGRVRTDGTWHATYWVAEWPRTDVAADFLGPLLLVADIRRSMSVVMEPVAAHRAARKIESARTADIADAELRRRGGFLATARRRREEEVLAQREIELADGHASFRFSGYLTVSAAGADVLEEACGRVEQAAGQSGLELRRCYGDQAQAFTCTLPLGRGLA